MDRLSEHLKAEYLRLRLKEILKIENIVKLSKEALEEESKKSES